MSPKIPRAFWIATTIGLVFMFVTYLVGMARYASTQAFVAALRGESFWIQTPSQIITMELPRDSIKVKYFIQNLTGYPVKLLGLKTSCTCTSIAQLPLSLNPYSGESLTMDINTSGRDTGFSATTYIFTDNTEYKQIKLVYVIETPASAKSGSKKPDK